MTVTLSPQTQKLIDERLSSGEYATVDDVLHAALTALDELESIELDEETLDALDEAEDQIERGEVVKWKDVRDEIRAEFRGT
jgi:putative addiction module CopG family antidote